MKTKLLVACALSFSLSAQESCDVDQAISRQYKERLKEAFLTSASDACDATQFALLATAKLVSLLLDPPSQFSCIRSAAKQRDPARLYSYFQQKRHIEKCLKSIEAFVAHAESRGYALTSKHTSTIKAFQLTLIRKYLQLHADEERHLEVVRRQLLTSQE